LRFSCDGFQNQSEYSFIMAMMSFFIRWNSVTSIGSK
jgi:hypothetical protein